MSANPQNETVSVREETITLPTYPPASPDPNPMFIERRTNQGTSGRVYPNPFTERLSDVSEPREHQAVYLENDYLRVMLLPEHGGRIYEAVDKTTGYNLIYRQHVIKPALIGLLGSWISGGVEFNWPQHHRPSTFMPAYHEVEHHSDGSITVWMGDHDPLERLKGMVGICLYPGKALMEFKVRLHNRTPLPQTFLWWVNLAVHVHDAYQMVFPPDVTLVTDHAKRSMATYPVVDGQYYGVDYDGVDISWYKNVPVPTSYFAWASDYDFFGGYDHRADEGILHIANRYIAPGKKMFTWGAGEFGKGWEENLTDADGPYIELMAGVYTDNQPDFSYLQPYETKTFSQYWYPVQRIGLTKNANRRAAVNLEVAEDTAQIGVIVTETLENATISLSLGDRVLYTQNANLVPGEPFMDAVDLPQDAAETDLVICVQDAEGEGIRYAPKSVPQEPLPEPKTPPPDPETFETIEELYLTGLHLEQYRYPTIDPEPYWEAALAQDPTDVRCNNALGLSHLRRGNYDNAQAHFQTAIDKLTRRNPNPRDGEPFYNLGLALKGQGRLDDAYAAFYKAIWSYAWQAPGYLALAQIDCLRGQWHTALEHLDRSLLTNAVNNQARNLKAAVLARLGRYDEAEKLLNETLTQDPLDIWARSERVALAHDRGDQATADALRARLSEWMHTSDALVEIQAYLDVAFDYMAAGLWDRAADVLERAVERPELQDYPMLWYTLGYLAEKQDRPAEAEAHYRRGSEASPDYCFPARLQECAVLEGVLERNPDDGMVACYLGNLYYDKKRYEEAIAAWEQAVAQQPDLAIPWRNLGIAHYNVRRDPEAALRCYERALEANPQNGRQLTEYTHLLKLTGTPAEERLAILEANRSLVQQRDDLSVQLAELYNVTGQHQKALEYITGRRFHPWEGGTGRVWSQYVAAHHALAQAALGEGQPEQALSHIAQARECPPNLGERKHLLWPDAHLSYTEGLAHRQLGDEEAAHTAWQRVLDAKADLSAVAYYQALALREIGDEDGATAMLEELEAGARNKLAEEPKRKFGTSGGEIIFWTASAEELERVGYRYLVGLAQLGLGRPQEAAAMFTQVLEANPDHLDALNHLNAIRAQVA